MFLVFLANLAHLYLIFNAILNSRNNWATSSAKHILSPTATHYHMILHFFSNKYTGLTCLVANRLMTVININNTYPIYPILMTVCSLRMISKLFPALVF